MKNLLLGFNNAKINNIIFFGVLLFASSMLGFLAFFLPVAIIKGIREEFLHSIISESFNEVIFVPTIILLILFGVILGYFGEKKWFLIGVFSMLIFPLNTCNEMISYISSDHNLWPIELFAQGIFCLPAVIGSFLGAKIKIKKRGGKPGVAH